MVRGQTHTGCSVSSVLAAADIQRCAGKNCLHLHGETTADDLPWPVRIARPAEWLAREAPEEEMKQVTAMARELTGKQ